MPCFISIYYSRHCILMCRISFFLSGVVYIPVFPCAMFYIPVFRSEIFNFLFLLWSTFSITVFCVHFATPYGLYYNI